MKANRLLVLLMFLVGQMSCSKAIDDSGDKMPKTRLSGVIDFVDAQELTEQQAHDLAYGVLSSLSPTYADWHLGFTVTKGCQYTQPFQVDMGADIIIYYRGIFLGLYKYCPGGCDLVIYASCPEYIHDIYLTSDLTGASKGLKLTGNVEDIYEVEAGSNALTPVGRRYEYACECEYDHVIVPGLWLCVQQRSVKDFERLAGI